MMKLVLVGRYSFSYSQTWDGVNPFPRTGTDGQFQFWNWNCFLKMELIDLELELKFGTNKQN